MVPWIMGYPEVMLRNKLFNYAGQKSAWRKSPFDISQARLNEALGADAFACSVSAVCL
jgi:hypothetical protein